MKARKVSRMTAMATGLAVVTVLALGWTAHVMVSDVNKQGTEGEDVGMGFHGLSAPLSVNERIGRATLVVAGKPTRVEVQAFRDAVSASELPVNEREDPIYLNGSFSRYFVDVEKVIKAEGRAPGQEVEVRTYASTPGVSVEGPGRPDIKIGQRYVFVLFRGEGVWQNSWLILGEDGLATLDGDTATFPSGHLYSLEELLDMA